MAQLSKGYTYTAGSPNNVVNYTNLNQLVDAATLLPGAITDQSTATPVSGDSVLIYSASAGGLRKTTIGGMMIVGSNAVFDITQINLLKLAPETGYVTFGTITLALDGKSNAYIGLTGNATFAVSGMAAGAVLTVALKNTTGGSITLSYPSWTVAGDALPTSLAAGAACIIRLQCYGTNTASIFASS